MGAMPRPKKKADEKGYTDKERKAMDDLVSQQKESKFSDWGKA